MTVLLVFALIAPVAQDPKPKDPPAKQPAKAEIAFGLTADSKYYWPFHIIQSPDVQKELKLTKQQLKAFETAQADLEEATRELPLLKPAQAKAQAAKVTKWAEETVVAILTPEQQKRHRQILWQVLESGGGAYGQAANPVFAKEVGLTADQVKQAKKIETDYLAAWQKMALANPLAGNMPLPGEEELRKKAEDAALKLLKPEQKKRWNEALGEPFKGEVWNFPIPGLRQKTFKAPAEKK